jgi:poly(A) RNA polymerase GLD2
VTTIKRWAKFHDINDAAKQTISSYSLVLMAIFYLQNVCKPAVLPVLQELYPVSY